MAIDNFIPQIWANRILENLNAAHVFADRLNRDYEGDIRAHGDSVRINSIGRVTISDYVKNGTITAPETLQGSDMVLEITQAKYFNFEIDDIDKWQQKPKLMDAATRETAWSMADAVDTYLAGVLQAGSTNNVTGAAGAVLTIGTGGGETNAYVSLVNAGVALTEQNVPTRGRWAVIPPWMEGMLLKDDRFVSYGTVANRDDLKNGNIGRAAGFDIFVSNNLSSLAGAGVNYYIQTGVNESATYAEQIDDTEAFRPEGSFSDALKGLHLYGAKVTRPYGLCYIYGTEGT